MATKRPLIIAGTAVLSLVVAAALRPSPAPAEPRRPDRRPVHRPVKPESSFAVLPTVQAPPELPAPTPPPAAEAPSSRLQGIPQDGDLLAPWVVGLPDPEFKTLIGTRELDEIVGRVMDRLMARRTDYDRPGEVEQFVERLNTRIRTLQD